MKSFVLILIIGVLNGCAMQSVKHAYDGELDSTEGLAVIWTARENFTAVKKVNDEKVNAFVRAVYVKPGLNTVRVQRSEEVVLGMMSNWSWLFTFNAEAGHTYYFAPVSVGISKYSLVGYDGGVGFADVTQEMSSKEHKRLRDQIKQGQAILLNKP